jgi:hypothetical protein
MLAFGVLFVGMPWLVVLTLGIVYLLNRDREREPQAAVQRPAQGPGSTPHQRTPSAVDVPQVRIFVDETGTGDIRDRSSSHLRVVAVLAHPDVWAPLWAELQSIARNAEVTDGQTFRFQGIELFQGTGAWVGVDPQVRADAYLSVIDLLAKYQMKIAHATVDKSELAERAVVRRRGSRHWREPSADAHLLGLKLLFGAIGEPMDAGPRNVSIDKRKSASLVSARNHAEVQELGDGFIYAGPDWTLHRLNGATPTYNPGLIMADMVAYAIQRSQRGLGRDARTRTLLQALTERIDEATISRVSWP